MSQACHSHTFCLIPVFKNAVEVHSKSAFLPLSSRCNSTQKSKIPSLPTSLRISLKITEHTSATMKVVLPFRSLVSINYLKESFKCY